MINSKLDDASKTKLRPEKTLSRNDDEAFEGEIGPCPAAACPLGADGLHAARKCLKNVTIPCFPRSYKQI